MLMSMGQLLWYRCFFSRATESGLGKTLASAEEGDADAQFALGLKFSTSAGNAFDPVQAAQWYRKAADQNHSLAQFNLSVMFARGQGVPRDNAAALIWTRKAAERGDAGAQFSLGSKYHRSSLDRSQMDSVESRIEAFKWFHLAAAQGYGSSEVARDRVTMGMSREEVAEGAERAATFVAARLITQTAIDPAL